jgi:hypothetical protein
VNDCDRTPQGAVGAAADQRRVTPAGVESDLVQSRPSTEAGATMTVEPYHPWEADDHEPEWGTL